MSRYSFVGARRMGDGARHVHQTAVDAVVRLVASIARAGEPCPQNSVLAGRLGWEKATRASAALSQAERDGLIVVHHGKTSRVIEAADGSWRTAGEITLEPTTRRNGRPPTRPVPPPPPPPAPVVPDRLIGALPPPVPPGRVVLAGFSDRQCCWRGDDKAVGWARCTAERMAANLPYCAHHQGIAFASRRREADDAEIPA